ncbi:MAG: hypothetical protein NT076_04855 [Candidatus Pacearchaeota archaeon]|nr:hypothetical protein [Candidatus Pacearchaeota archaeon]
MKKLEPETKAPYKTTLEMCRACGDDFEKPGSCGECLDDKAMNALRDWMETSYPGCTTEYLIYR